MAFKRAVSDTFPAKVTVNVPNGRGGFDKNTFTGVFRRPPSEELTELRALHHEEVVRRTLVGWDLVDEDSKQEVPFSPSEMEALLQISPTPIATAMAFWEQISGARAKNS